MLPDEANIQKQKKRHEQIKRYEELDMIQSNDYEKSSKKVLTKVKFPQGCVFLAACTSNDYDEVKQYLKIGVNINTTNIDGLTALHQACIDDNFDMVKFLVENNADLNPQDNEGWTPLHAAVSVGNIDVVKYLITKGAKLNICNNDGDLPIDLCDSANVQMRSYLEDEMKQQNIDAEYEKTREELIMYEDAKEMNFRDKIHPKTGATPLHVSAAKGYTRVMKLLIQSGVNINAVDKDGWTPLHAAAHWEQEEACRILAENGASFDIRNYSGQTPFEVCDEDMVMKLKSIQNKIKSASKDKTIELTAINNTLTIKTDPRANRRSSDELRSSIIRISAETKSTISEREKKEEKDKLLLSPTLKTTQNDFANGSDTSDNEKLNENDDSKNKQANKNSEYNQFKYDKENINTNKNDSLTSTSLPISTNSSDDQLSLAKLNKSKAGLQETLKSLSAQVKQNMDEDDYLDKIRWGNTPTSNDSIYKRKSNNSPSGSSNENTNTTPIVNNTNLTSTPVVKPAFSYQSTPENLNSSNNNNISSTNEDSVLSPLSQNIDTSIAALKNNSDAQRRYSLAPLASKDEQAELIRKQKAKLERHFRRSTQAVSYEDIKSAEATIKASNTATTTQQSVSVASPPPLPPSQPPPLLEQPQSPKQVTTPQTLLNNSNNDTNKINETRSSFSNEQKQIAQQQEQQTHTENNVEKDSIIAKDIETDKLLNVLEIKKGFLDSSSTTRRLRNRPNMLNGSLSYTPDRDSINDDNVSNNTNPNKKINKLIWNEDRLEVEYRNREDDDHDSVDNNSEFVNTNNNTNYNNNSNQVVMRRQQSVPEQNNRLLSHTYSAPISSSPIQFTSLQSTVPTQLSPQLSTSLTSSTSSQIQQDTSSNPHSSRQSFRFSSSNEPSSSLTQQQNNVRSNIKRSISQIPNTDNNNRKSNSSAINTTPTLNSTNNNNNNNNNNSFVNNTNLNNNQDIMSNKLPNTDDRQTIEALERENETLKLNMKKIQKELDEQVKKNQTMEINTVDKKEKRAYERKISELEEEIKKSENLKQDNIRLKEENAALIRVISKLSK